MDSIDCPVLSFLSQRAVAAEVGRNPPPFHRSAGCQLCGSAGSTSPRSSPMCSG